ncbi:hypothetical protein AB0395_04495 [Streptosporangium sp. NPDC051023]|uniref:hypothetical protein n=1 Tax=Streptosporangium sp. NPDC051023 TaxID=3155410 RepID=UPI00344E2C40
MRALKSLLVVVAATVAMLAGTTPAQAATGWSMEWGATNTESTIDWTSGYSAYVSGHIKAVSGYREVCFWGVNGSYSTDTVCRSATNSTTTWSNVHLQITVAGGVQRIYADLWVNGTAVHEVWCTRNGCSRNW